ncbi:MAG: UMP kinase [Planctomycetota bacterium]|jgi:uridylate kinase
MTPPFRRVLLKLSGEGLSGAGGAGYSPEALRALGREIAALRDSGTQVAIVVGAGNLVRGRDLPRDLIDRTVADAAGMLGTVMNALVLAGAIRDAGAPASVLAAVAMPDVAESFRADRARALLDAGEVVVLGGGTGRPYFTTDTAAVLRALEVKADVLLKATTVDGVYDSDPRENPDAKRFTTLSWREVVDRRLGVMDLTAFTLCEENELPIVVFNLSTEGHLARAVTGEDVGTRIGSADGAPSDT